VFSEERADLTPALDLSLPGQAHPRLWETGLRVPFIAEGSHQWLHDFSQRLPLGQRGGDKGPQGPQGLRLRVSTTRCRRAVKLSLDLPLECVKQGFIVWGCFQ